MAEKIESVTLGPGPVLKYCPFGNSASGTKQHDVTEQAVQFLFEPVTLVAPFTLADLFRLLDTHDDLRRVFRRDYATELCVEARKGPLPPLHGADSIETPDMEYLELYRQWRLDSEHSIWWGVHDLYLHGIGIPLAVDAPEHGVTAGERIQWSVSLTPLRELLHLPLRVRESFEVSEDDIDARDYGKLVAQGKSEEVLLGQLIHATLWELSFHGTPQAQAEVSQDLKERICELDAGTVETIPHDEMFAEFDRPGFASLFETLGGTPESEVKAMLREIPDEDAAGPYLVRAFGARVVVKPAFHELPGRAFRRAFRTARTTSKP